MAIFPNEAASTRRVGAMLWELNDEGGLNGRGIQLEGEHSHRDAAPAPVSAIQR